MMAGSYTPEVTIVCSLYFALGSRARKDATVVWYRELTKSAGINFNLWLINDCSREPVRDLLNQLGPQGYCKEIRFFDSNTREGKAVKLNHLLRIVPTKYVAVVDNDVLLPTAWLVETIAVLSHPKVGACGVICEPWIPIGDTKATWNNVEFSIPPWIGGACIVWDRKKVGPHGFFFEGFDVYGHEDAEFVFRVNMFVGKVAAIRNQGTCSIVPDEPGYQKWKEGLLKGGEDHLQEMTIKLVERTGRTIHPVRLKDGTWVSRVNLEDQKGSPPWSSINPPTFAHQIPDKEASKCSLPIKRRKP